MHRIVRIGMILFIAISGWSQMKGKPEILHEQTNLPRVFMIGEYEKPYESMSAGYDKMLLNAYGDDLTRAFYAWTSILMEMENYAREVHFDLSGLKLWMNVFINQDGTIQHIVYFPKPNSRNMEFELLTDFLNNFCKVYRFKDPLTVKCAHFGSASFPTFISRN